MCISEGKDLGLISDKYERSKRQEEEKKCDVMWKKCVLIISFYMEGYLKDFVLFLKLGDESWLKYVLDILKNNWRHNFKTLYVPFKLLEENLCKK